MNTTELFAPERKKARIEIIPLIDVVFFLLATFVLFTLSLDRISSVPAQLPVTRPGPVGEDATVYIQTTADGMVYWKLGAKSPAELVSLAELPPRLADYQRHVPIPRVFVRGDNRAKFGAAVAVFDIVREAGISQVSIETMPSATGS